MLTNLFHSLQPATRRSSARNPPLDSHAEDSHTLGLLFPGSFLNDGDGVPQPFPSTDIATSRLPAATCDLAGYDVLDLECPRDIRIFIAQSSQTAMQAELLFDSNPPPLSESPKLGHGRHSRTGSRSEAFGPIAAAGSRGRASNTPVPPILEDQNHHRRNSSAFSSQGAMQRARMRRSSISSAFSYDDSPIDTGRERDELEKIALGIMFDNAPSSYKGTSNKVHIVPLASKPYENAFLSQSLGNELPGSFGGRQGVRKPSSLSRSTMPGDATINAINTDVQYRDTPAGSHNQPTRRTVLVTRTFSVTWVEDEVVPTSSKSFGPSAPRGATGHHRSAPIAQQEKHQARSRTIRSPMYAVTVALHLPISPNEISPSLSRTSTFGRRLARKDSSSHQSHASLGSSVDSDRKGPLSALDSYFGIDSFASMAASSDVDDRVDLIGRHWDIISRTLTTIQNLAQHKILQLLRSQARSQRPIRLPAQALSADVEIKKIADESANRIVRGMHIHRVRIGHGRWVAWREEAKWLSKWAGGRDQNFFLLILLSAFLGTHLEWIQLLAPKACRRKFRELQKISSTSKMALPNRTVIISPDKMAARRLIFLLSAFLPSNHSSRGDVSPMRPGTSASYRAYSRSPPAHMPLSRQESLRRTINRRGKPSSSRTRQPVSRASSMTIASETHDDRTETGTIRPSAGENHHPRRPSDARSTRSSKLAITEFNPSGQKSVTTASSDAVESMPVAPHFTRQPSYTGQPGHSRTSSTASVTLNPPLQRSGSSSSQSKTWGYTLRNLWGSRRESNSDYSDILQTTDEGLGIMGVRNFEQPSRLQQMVDEVHGLDLEDSDATLGGYRRQSHMSPELRDSSPDALLRAQRDASAPIDVPLRMSVNNDDGVIDVEIPFPDYGSPPILSPGLPRNDHSGSSFGGSSFDQHSFLTMSPNEPETHINVSGWLDRPHADFTLQATKPYGDVLSDIKAAMLAEPTPELDLPLSDASGTIEKWIEVCTTLVADTRDFSIKRFRLRRLVRFDRPSSPHNPVHHASIHGLGGARSQYGNPYSHLGGPSGSTAPNEITLEEKIDEERVADMDRDFVDVVERIIGLYGSPSKGSSGSNSRSSSCRGRTESMDHDVRDCKRMVIGTLENIIAGEIKDRNVPRSPTDPRMLHENESTLRDGVRRWLDELERRSATVHETNSGGKGPVDTQSMDVPMAKKNKADDIGMAGSVERALSDADITPTPSTIRG